MIVQAALLSFCSDFLSTFHSDNYSNGVYVLGNKYVLGPPYSSFSLPPYGSNKNDSEACPNLNSYVMLYG